MCGIAGIVDFKTRETAAPVVGHMLDLMAHRGPDASGIYQSDPVALGHARLSIIDLSTSGDQPIHNEDKRLWITFNGEIFNYPELRSDLIEKGHRFYTQTDTEVLIHLYEEHGTDMFAHLNASLHLPCGMTGGNPSCWQGSRGHPPPCSTHRGNQRLTFSSEIKAIFADPSIPRSLDPQTLSDIFTCWTAMGGSTAFSDIHQLPPGHFARFDKDGLSLQPLLGVAFWCRNGRSQNRGRLGWKKSGPLLLDATPHPPPRGCTGGRLPEWGDRQYLHQHQWSSDISTIDCIPSPWASRIRASTRPPSSRLPSTLSVPSTTPSAAPKRISAEFSPRSYGTPRPRCSGPDHRRSSCYPDWFAKVDSKSSSPEKGPMRCSQVITSSRRPKSDDSGQSTRIPKCGRLSWPDSILTFSRAPSPVRFCNRFFKRNLTDVASPAYSHLLRWHNTDQLKGFFSADQRNRSDSLTGFIDRYTQRLPEGFMGWDMLTRAQYTESSLFLSNYLLSSQGDRMAMANSIEGRFPFLDHRVFESAARIPSRLRMRGLTEKYILKKAARGLIPDPLIDRAKQPYRAPISRCFFGDAQPDYVSDLLSDQKLKSYGYFDEKKVTRLVAKCSQGKGALLSERENMALVGILSTQLIHHQFIDAFSIPENRRRENATIR